ncbi:hypothetical protein BCR39DRAFT_472088, partial [Naematelia encephala]
DTASSVPSDGRPTTPSKALHVARSSPPPAQADHLTLAIKAERILGLTPGTLAHAKACLEHARDEVRRTAEPASPSTSAEGAGGMRGRLDRAKKSMSVALTSNNWSTGVVVGAGGQEEEEKRERRRRAADGVIYWQRQVANLEMEEARAKR